MECIRSATEVKCNCPINRTLDVLMTFALFFYIINRTEHHSIPLRTVTFWLFKQCGRHEVEETSDLNCLANNGGAERWKRLQKYCYKHGKPLPSNASLMVGKRVLQG
ncbi:hypothetical protein AVEN_178450-1 [Araneus ventricosus]|uniref:Uncharacterized protein n=1 Tax=Araneus ventricosus TaxID=182803 RepID=A0A4Y2TC78_ARAVE|nr:hypothetical protein AVEN_178450-1 [Araneus ventricosus]